CIQILTSADEFHTHSVFEIKCFYGADNSHHTYQDNYAYQSHFGGLTVTLNLKNEIVDKMQAYKIQVDNLKAQKPTYTIVFYINKNNCETFCHTATLLIHTLKYLASISLCFTKEKNRGRV